MSIDFNNIQKTALGLRESFEEMICQIFENEYSKFGDYKRFFNSPGIEARGLNQERKKIGIQSKFLQKINSKFFHSSNKAQIKHSINKTIEYFPNIKIWILAIPYNLSGSDESEWDDIKNEYPQLKFELWNNSSITNYLMKYTYLYQFWVDKVINFEHIKEVSNFNASKISFNPNYHIESTFEKFYYSLIHQNIPEMKKIEWNFLYSNFNQLISNFFNEVNEIKNFLNSLDNFEVPDITSLNYENLTFSFCYESIFQYIDEFILRFQSNNDNDIFSELVFIETLKNYTMSFPYLMNQQIENIKDQLEEPGFENEDTISNFINYIEDMKIKFDEISYKIREFLYFAINVIKSKYSLIENTFGMGKSHSLANLYFKLKDEFLCIFFRGIDFSSSENLNNEIMNLIGHGSTSIISFTKNLESYAKLLKKPIIIIFDGINESKYIKLWKEVDSFMNLIINKYIHVIVSTRPIKNPIINSTINNIFFFNPFPIEVEFDKIIESYEKFYNIQVINSIDNNIPFRFLRLMIEEAKKNSKFQININNFSVRKFLPNHTDFLDEYYINSNDKDPNIPWISKFLLEISKLMIKSFEPKLLKSKIQHYLDQEWSRSELKFLIEEEVLRADEEYIYFTNQDFLSFYLSLYLIKESPNDLIFDILGDGQDWLLDVLKSYVITSNILMNELEFGFYIKIKSILKMKLKKIRYYSDLIDIQSIRYLDERTDFQFQILRKIFNKRTNLRNELFISLINSTNIPSIDVLDFLNSILRPLSMTDRDLSFGEYVRINREKIIKIINNHSFNSEENLNSAVTFFSFFLSSEINYIRDITSKCLVNAGNKFPDETLKILISNISINDIYISERLFAIILGIITNNSISSELNDSISIIIKEKVFKEGKFEHLLIRDYSYQILSYLKPELIDFNLFTAVSKEIKLNQKYQKLLDREPTWGLRDYTIRMDFAKYILGPISGYRSQRSTLPKLSTTVCLVREMIDKMGYSYKNFHLIDDKILKDEPFRPEYKIERWAKKYSWIAFYILASKRFIHIEDFDIRLKRNLDPTFPADNSIELSYNFMNAMNNNFPSECLNLDHIKPIRMDGLENEWIILDMDYINKLNEFRLSFEINSLLFPKSDEFNLAQELRSHEIYDLFSGEDPSLYYYNDEIKRYNNFNEINKLAYYFNWEGHQNKINKRIRIPQPYPWLIKKLNLKKEAKSFDWYDNNGLSILCRILRTDNFLMSSVFIMRKDLVVNLLNEGFELFLYSIADKDYSDNPRVSHFQWGKLDSNYKYLRLECSHN